MTRAPTLDAVKEQGRAQFGDGTRSPTQSLQQWTQRAREGLQSARELGSGVREELRDELHKPVAADQPEPRRSSL